MTERQRPRQTARALRNSLTNEFVEKRETLEQLARFPSDDCLHLRRGHTANCHKREIHLHSRRHRNWAVRLVFAGSLLDRLEIDLQSERGTRPHRRVEPQAARYADRLAINGDVPQDLSGTRYHLDSRSRKRRRCRRLSDELDVPLVVARLHSPREMRWRALTHHESADMDLFSRQSGLLRSRKIRWSITGEERGTDLEQADVSLHVGQVVLGASNQCRQQIPPQIRFVL